MNRSGIGNYRWTICALLFFATSINYLDRAIISLLKSPLENQFHWNENDYAHLVIAFQASYALGMAGIGRLMDRIGSKKGYALAITAWSVAAIMHGWVRNLQGFLMARAALGLSESGNFPAAIKAVSEWFPKKERALATGIFNAGTNIGAIVAPLTVPFVAARWGWQWAFIGAGSFGFVWLFFWLILYKLPEKEARLSPEEMAYIHSDKDEPAEPDERQSAPKLSWLKLLGFRQTWAFVAGKFLTDPIWWFFLFWLPAFLKAQYNMDGKAIAVPVASVYAIAILGSVGGGWLPLYLIKRGRSVFSARKISMFMYALLVIPVVFAQWLGSYNPWLAVMIIALAASAHQAWSANIFTTVSDLFPRKAVGSVTGIGGMAGGIGSIVIASLAGRLFEKYKALGHLQTGYYIMFFICAFAYLLAWLLMHLLVPRMKAASI